MPKRDYKRGREGERESIYTLLNKLQTVWNTAKNVPQLLHFDNQSNICFPVPCWYASLRIPPLRAFENYLSCNLCLKNLTHFPQGENAESQKQSDSVEIMNEFVVDDVGFSVPEKSLHGILS